MKRILVMLLTLMLPIGLVACGGGKEEAAPTIIGSWESVDISGAIYTFEEGGKGSYTFAGASMDFTYTDDGTAVTIQYPNSDAPNVFKYTIEGKKLNIEDSFGSIVVYEKM